MQKYHFMFAEQLFDRAEHFSLRFGENDRCHHPGAVQGGTLCFSFPDNPSRKYIGRRYGSLQGLSGPCQIIIRYPQDEVSKVVIDAGLCGQSLLNFPDFKTMGCSIMYPDHQTQHRPALSERNCHEAATPYCAGKTGRHCICICPGNCSRYYYISVLDFHRHNQWQNINKRQEGLTWQAEIINDTGNAY